MNKYLQAEMHGGKQCEIHWLSCNGKMIKIISPSAPVKSGVEWRQKSLILNLKLAMALNNTSHLLQ